MLDEAEPEARSVLLTMLSASWAKEVSYCVSIGRASRLWSLFDDREHRDCMASRHTLRVRHQDSRHKNGIRTTPTDIGRRITLRSTVNRKDTMLGR